MCDDMDDERVVVVVSVLRVSGVHILVATEALL
jgi:hypothetical protein